MKLQTHSLLFWPFHSVIDPMLYSQDASSSIRISDGEQLSSPNVGVTNSLDIIAITYFGGRHKKKEFLINGFS